MFDISKIYENIISCYTYADVCDAEEIVKERHDMTKFEPVFLSGDRVTARKVALIRYQAAIFKKYYYNFAVKNGYDGTFNAFVAEFEEVIVKRMGQIQAFDMLYTSELIEFYVDVDLTLMAMTFSGVDVGDFIIECVGDELFDFCVSYGVDGIGVGEGVS